jgi:hypothetical protein
MIRRGAQSIMCIFRRCGRNRRSKLDRLWRIRQLATKRPSRRSSSETSHANSQLQPRDCRATSSGRARTLTKSADIDNSTPAPAQRTGSVIPPQLRHPRSTRQVWPIRERIRIDLSPLVMIDDAGQAIFACLPLSECTQRITAGNEMNSGSGPAGEQLPGFAGSRSRGRNRCACAGLVRLEPHVSSGARKVARCQTRLLEMAEHKWSETAASDTHRVRRCPRCDPSAQQLFPFVKYAIWCAVIRFGGMVHEQVFGAPPAA